jgi:hypothetical protein
MQSGEIRYFGPKYEITQILCRDWHVFHRRSQGATVSLDRETKHSGQASATVKGRTTLSGVIRNVHVPENRARYRLSFWYRCSGANRVFCGGMFYGIKELPGLNCVAPASLEWKRYETVLTVNAPKEEQTDFTLLLAPYEAGSDESQVWFDDVRLEWLSPDGLEKPAGGQP